MALVSLRFLIIVLLFYLTCHLVSCQREDYIHKKSRGFPWPLPANFTIDPSNACQISEKIVFDFGSLASCDLMIAAEQRAFRYIFGRIRDPKEPAPELELSPALSLIIIRLNSTGTKLEQDSAPLPIECQPEHYPNDEMDESYHLQVTCTSSSVATLTANSVYGLLRGIETFTQITYMDEDGNIMMNSSKIYDKPAYPWRGVLLDTSRHFLPMSILLQNLEIMAANKFNVFHWHIVDDPSFPWVSTGFPQLAAAGAYRPVALHTYSPTDVKKMVDHGRLLGIRIVAEFDTPGHTQSWGSGVPELLTSCHDDSGTPLGTFGALDPSSPELWPQLAAIFEEVFQVFPDRYLHLGGDEVGYEFACWLKNPRVKELMQTLGITTGEELQNYYTKMQLRLLDAVTREKGRYVYWQEVFDNKIDLPEDRAVVHVWYSNQSAMTAITKAGLQALYSTCWYLDNLGGTRDWTGYYACDPLSFNMTFNPDLQRKLVMGGEACLWGEYVDAVNVLPRLWPRASAVAERLWTDPRSKTARDPISGLPMASMATENVEKRLEEHRCRMVGRGWPAQPVIGPGFCDIEYRSV